MHPEAPHLPPLTDRQSQILSAFIAAGGLLAAVLRDHNIPAAELLEWSSSPAVQLHLAALTHLSDTALAYSASQSRIAALSKLQSILASSDNPIEQRRLCNSITAASSDKRNAGSCHGFRPSSGDTRADRPNRDDPPVLEHCPPKYVPGPSLSHRLIASVVACALRTPKSPAALLAIRAYLAPNAKVDFRPAPVEAEHFVRFASIRFEDLHDARYSSPYLLSEPTDTTARYRISVSHDRGHTTHLSLTLSRHSDISQPQCWLISDLSFDSS